MGIWKEIKNEIVIQRKILFLGNKMNKEIFVATNFLESMLENNYPTRSEVNDIYNTLLDGADGLVLAAETAIGNFPTTTVSIISRLMKNTEKWTQSSSINDILSF